MGGIDCYAVIHGGLWLAIPSSIHVCGRVLVCIMYACMYVGMYVCMLFYPSLVLAWLGFPALPGLVCRGQGGGVARCVWVWVWVSAVICDFGFGSLATSPTWILPQSRPISSRI
ncbi:hypothetical protein F4802DRAFT_35398 [Xylaria palmicola]|nr:hypothetical protein F4802DRAFT_35398 [Xylaria palmicola]